MFTFKVDCVTSAQMEMLKFGEVNYNKKAVL